MCSEDEHGSVSKLHLFTTKHERKQTSFSLSVLECEGFEQSFSSGNTSAKSEKIGLFVPRLEEVESFSTESTSSSYTTSFGEITHSDSSNSVCMLN